MHTHTQWEGHFSVHSNCTGEPLLPHATQQCQSLSHLIFTGKYSGVLIKKNACNYIYQVQVKYSYVISFQWWLLGCSGSVVKFSVKTSCCGVNLQFLALPALTPVHSVLSAFGPATKKRQKKTIRPERQCHLKDRSLQLCLVSLGILKVSYLLDCTLSCC